MKRVMFVAMAACLVASVAQAQNPAPAPTPTDAEMIERAVLAAAPNARAAAMVVKWNADGTRVTLRPGTNNLVCWDQSVWPHQRPFSAALRGDSNAAVATAAGSATYFYVSCGTRDSLLPASQQFVTRLAEQKLAHEYHEIPGGEHAWNVWDEELRVFFSVVAKRPTWRP